MPEPLAPECIFEVLAAHGVEYVLIGGLGAVLHGSTAMTNDADIFPDADPANLARLADALRDLAARIRSTDSPEGVAFDPHPDLLAGMAMLNLTTRCGDLDVAMQPAGLGAYAGVRADADEFDIADCTVPVARLADIIRSKETADRPKDRNVLPLLYALEDEIARRRDAE